MCILCGNGGHVLGPWEVMVGSVAVYGVYDMVLQPVRRRLFGMQQSPVPVAAGEAEIPESEHPVQFESVKESAVRP